MAIKRIIVTDWVIVTGLLKLKQQEIPGFTYSHLLILLVLHSAIISAISPAHSRI